MPPAAARRPDAAAHARRGGGPAAPDRRRARCCAAPSRTAQLHSMILWGPPGTGKTTLAQLVAARGGRALRAVLRRHVGREGDPRGDRRGGAPSAGPRAGARSCSSTRSTASTRPSRTPSCPTWRRATVVLVGATTENPSFEVNAALLSRCRVYVLQPLAEDDSSRSCARARGSPSAGWARRRRGRRRRAGAASRGSPTATRAARSTCSSWRRADAAARRADRRRPCARGGAEEGPALRQVGRGALQPDLGAPQVAARLRSRRARSTGSARMLEAGEDPLYVARRMVRFASEDVGIADPHALRVTLDAKEAFTSSASPEGELALAQAAVLSRAGAQVQRRLRGLERRRRTTSRASPPSRCRWPSATRPPGS